MGPRALPAGAARGYDISEADMDHYFRFIMMSALGLWGVVIVLKTLIEGLFNDWDAYADLRAVWKGNSVAKGILPVQRTEDFLLEIENAKAPTFNTRLTEKRLAQSPVEAVPL